MLNENKVTNYELTAHARDGKETVVELESAKSVAEKKPTSPNQISFPA